jgi:hypothetical protein
MNEMPTGPLDLAIVIVNYNTSALLRDCLQSVFASSGDLATGVCVVDNASPDDSVAVTRRDFPQVRLIANQANVGYPAANNQGLRHFGFRAEAASPGPAGGVAALPRFALLLNPDTVLPPGALAQMVAFLEKHPEAGVAGPKLVRLDGTLDKACYRSFPTPDSSLWHLLQLDRAFPRSPRFGRYNLTFMDPDQVAKVDAVVGAFMMVRREAIAQAGLLDEQFFMYGEDLDWAKRITDAGWEVWYNPRVQVTHIKAAASRHSYKARVEFYRAMDIFYRKHYRAETPFYLDWAIRGGVSVFGGLDLAARRLRGQYRKGAAA